MKYGRHLSLSTIKDVKPTDKSCVHGAPSPFFLKEHGFTVNYPPVDFINAFIPKMNWKKNFRDKTPYSLSVKTMCLWSNDKAVLMGMVGCKFYTSFQKNIVDNFEKHLYLYYFNGLNPLPRVQMKLISLDQDSVQGITFIHCVFGPATSLRQKQCNFVLRRRILCSNRYQEEHTLTLRSTHL